VHPRSRGHGENGNREFGENGFTKRSRATEIGLFERKYLCFSVSPVEFRLLRTLRSRSLRLLRHLRRRSGVAIAVARATRYSPAAGRGILTRICGTDCRRRARCAEDVLVVQFLGDPRRSLDQIGGAADHLGAPAAFGSDLAQCLHVDTGVDRLALGRVDRDRVDERLAAQQCRPDVAQRRGAGGIRRRRKSPATPPAPRRTVDERHRLDDRIVGWRCRPTLQPRARVGRPPGCASSRVRPGRACG